MFRTLGYVSKLECRLQLLSEAIVKATEVQEHIESLDEYDEFGAELEKLSITTKERITSLLSAVKSSSETKEKV